MTSKAIIFDAGPLISLSMNGLLPELIKLKEIFDGKFIITKEVKYEIVDHPIKIKRFELDALNIQRLLDKKILELPTTFKIDKKEITKNAQEFMNIANSAFKETNKEIHLVELGESSCLALSKLLTEKGIENIITIDERTMRVLCEKPENLRKLLEKKLHTKISYDKEKLKYFQEFKVIRSSELIYIAYKKNITKLSGKRSLEAYLYALKFKGCSISQEEINEIVNLS